jgi:ribosomal protein S18 acetylase RimI-like enzyme
MMGTRAACLDIRPATPSDIALLIQLIHELALAERFPFEVTAGAADLEKALFGPSPAAEAVIAEYESDVVGYAVFYETFATTTGRRGLHLDDLFIRPSHQGRGFGRQLLSHVARVAQSRECARLEWWSLRTNTAAISFYEALGSRPMEELLVFRLQGTALSSLAEP